MKKYASYKETHDLTGIATGTLYSLVSRKEIPHIRLGKRHVLFPVQELLEWCEKHKVKGTGGSKEARPEEVLR